MGTYYKNNVYYKNTLILSQRCPRKGRGGSWSLVFLKEALKGCGYDPKNCFFEELVEGSWINYRCADDIKDDYISDDYMDNWVKPWIEEMKKVKPSNISSFDWVNAISVFGFHLDRSDNQVILFHETEGVIEKWDEVPYIPQIKKAIWEFEKVKDKPVFTEGWKLLDLVNSMHLPFSKRNHPNDPSEYAINLWFMDNMVWESEGSDCGKYFKDWDKEVGRIKDIILDYQNVSGWPPVLYTVEVTTPTGPIYRNLDDFPVTTVGKNEKTEDREKIINEIREQLEYSIYEDDDSILNVETFFTCLKPFGFYLEKDENQISLKHKKYEPAIKSWKNDGLKEIFVPEFKGAIWECDFFRTALDTLCIVNPFHLPFGPGRYINEGW